MTSRATEPHRLTEKDPEALTATCSVCGPGSRIRRNGKRSFVCLTARRKAFRRWAKAHPDRARDSRSFNPSQHRLERRDGGPDVCAVCGPVEPKAWGRGWMCGKRFEELRWTSEQVEPAPKCGACEQRWLEDGKCPKCDAEPLAPLDPLTVGWLEQHGFHVVEDSWLEGDRAVFRPDTGPYSKYAHLADEWSGKEKYVKPEYAKLYGSGRK